MLNDINKNTKIFYKLFSSFWYWKSYRYSNIREQFIKRGTLKFFFHKNSYSSNLNSLVNFNKRSWTVKFDDVHKNYGLFRKGQHIGHISTLMQDPSDAVLVNEENSDELKYFTKLPKLSENFYEKLVEIKVSQRTKSPYNSPSGSWIQVNYLFSKFAELSVKYKKFTNNEIMVGKILEEIDVLSGESAYRYIKGRGVDLKGVIILTASVDQLDFNNYLSIEEDLKINTYVIYSGGSFIYVKSDIYSQSNDSLTFKGHAIFIMTARKDGKAFVVSPMELEVEDNSEMWKHREILGNELKEYITSLNTRIPYSMLSSPL